MKSIFSSALACAVALPLLGPSLALAQPALTIPHIPDRNLAITPVAQGNQGSNGDGEKLIQSDAEYRDFLSAIRNLPGGTGAKVRA